MKLFAPLLACSLADDKSLDDLTNMVQRVNRYNRKLIRENAMLLDQLHDEGIDPSDFKEKPERSSDEVISFNFALNSCACLEADSCPIVQETVTIGGGEYDFDVYRQIEDGPMMMGEEGEELSEATFTIPRDGLYAFAVTFGDATLDSVDLVKNVDTVQTVLYTVNPVSVGLQSGVRFRYQGKEVHLWQ